MGIPYLWTLPDFLPIFRSRDEKASAANKHGPQSLPFHILQIPSSTIEDHRHQPLVINEVNMLYILKYNK